MDVMNKLLKRIILAIIVVIAAVVIAITRPWTFFSNIPFLNGKAALTVNTPLGKSEVYLNGEKIGETPYSAENLNPGEYELEIKKITDTENFYTDFSDTIMLVDNTRTFIEVEIGPTDQFTSIKKFYYQETGGQSKLLINTQPENSTIWIDEVRYGEAPVTNDSLNPGRHDLKVEADGYETIESTIITREGYTLIADVQLMAKPVILDENSTE